MRRCFLFSALIILTTSGFSSDVTPVSLKKIDIKKDYSQVRDWEKPKYEEQKDVLGYTKESFAVPVELTGQVNFWIDMYTKYSTEQGVLHDSQNINFVYAVIDFSEIPNLDELSSYRQRRAKGRYVKKLKKEVRARLRKLHKLKSAEGLEGEDLRFWKMFEPLEEKSKFWRASKKGRLRFQLGQSDRFLQGIFYSGRYLDEMERIFQEKNLPLELTRLPFVESSFNLYARSRVGASGIWQFLRSTGRLYMRVDRYVDERNDPIISTKAAARHLKRSYSNLKNWSLAVTAYNYGVAGMRRLAKKAGAKSIGDLVGKARRRRFGFASQNFYASFLAALEVEKNADKYFEKVVWSEPLKYEEIKLPKRIGFKYLIKIFDGDAELTSLYNPHLGRSIRRGHLAIPRKRIIRVPVGKKEEVLAALEKAPKPNVSGTIKYRVVRGDTISEIAQRFRVSSRQIKHVNGLDDPRRLRAGQVLVIPRQ